MRCGQCQKKNQPHGDLVDQNSLIHNVGYVITCFGEIHVQYRPYQVTVKVNPTSVIQHCHITAIVTTIQHCLNAIGMWSDNLPSVIKRCKSSPPPVPQTIAWGAPKPLGFSPIHSSPLLPGRPWKPPGESWTRWSNNHPIRRLSIWKEIPIRHQQMLVQHLLKIKMSSQMIRNLSMKYNRWGDIRPPIR